MKFFRLDLLTLLISLFILNSCKNQSAIGLGVQPNQVNGSLVDTSTIVTNTVAEDSVVTSGTLTKNPLAYFNDPIFGLTVSDLATDINLPDNSAYTLPTGTIFVDSARLVLHYADGFYGDQLTTNYTVNVYQLNQKFNSDTAYYNTKKFSVNYSSLIGTWKFNARPKDSIKIYNIITGAPDTLIKVGPQIRIPISTTFINNNFFNAGSLALGSNAIFNNTLRGLYITLDKTKTTGPGGIIMVTPNDSLAVYYRTINGATIDTAVLYLPVTHFAASIQHTYSVAINTELSNQKSSRGVVYLQGLAGLRAKVSFPGLLANLRGNLAKHDSDIVLNRAELVITPSPGSTIPYQPLPQITMYKLDLANQRTYLQDANPADPRSGGATTFGGYYSSSATPNEYHFIVTAFLQDLLLGKTVDYGTYIAPIDTTTSTTITSSSYLPTTQASGRTMAVGGNSTSPYKMKLNIIYTKIHK